MCYATTVCSTRVVRVGLCVRSFGRGFLPTYESREVSTKLLDLHTSHNECGSIFAPELATLFCFDANNPILFC